jgi:hypothetical protein
MKEPFVVAPKFRSFSSQIFSEASQNVTVKVRVDRSGRRNKFTANIPLKVKVKLSLYRSWRPLGLREVEAPTFSDIRLIDGDKVVNHMRRPLFTPRKILGTHFCYRLSRPQGHSEAGRIRSIEKSISSWTRTGGLPACSIVPQPTTLPRSP